MAIHLTCRIVQRGDKWLHFISQEFFSVQGEPHPVIVSTFLRSLVPNAAVKICITWLKFIGFWTNQIVKRSLSVKLYIWYDLNTSKVGAVYIQHSDLVITVSADGLATNGARPPTGTVLTAKLDLCTSKFRLLLEILNMCSRIRRCNSEWLRDPMKSHCVMY